LWKHPDVVEMLRRRRGLTEEEKKAQKRAGNKPGYNKKKAKYNEMLARNKTNPENNKITEEEAKARIRPLRLGKGAWFRTKDMLDTLEADLKKKEKDGTPAEVEKAEDMLAVMKRDTERMARRMVDFCHQIDDMYGTDISASTKLTWPTEASWKSHLKFN
jgi:hypothetical protein